MGDSGSFRIGDRGAVIGREADLAAVERFVGEGEEGACLVLVGEPGIGKTTLWEAGIAYARSLGYRVLSSRCSQSEANLSFAALSDLLDGVDLTLAGLAEPQRDALEVALGRRAAAVTGVEPLNIAAGLLHVIRDMAAEGPLLIAIDDVHWIDRASAECVTFSARRLRALPARFLLSRHAGSTTDVERELKLVGVAGLELAGLSSGAIRALLSQRIAVVLPRRAVRQIAETSQGNPLLALELAQALARSGPTFAGELTLPSMIEELLGQRIAQMSPGLVRALLAVSLSGGLTTAELAQVVDPLVVEDALGMGYLTLERAKVRPTHPLLCAIIRRDSAAADRRQLHGDLARAVSNPTLRMRHLAIATAKTDAGLAGEISQASRWAQETGDMPLAAELAAHALRLTPSEHPDHGDRLIALGRCQINAGDLESAVELLTTRFEEVPPGRLRALAHLALGECATVLEEERHLDRALVEAGDDPSLQAVILARRAIVMMLNRVERIDEAEQLALRALRAERAWRAAEDPRLDARIFHVLAWVEALSGHAVRGADFQIDPLTIDHYDAAVERPRAVRMAFRGDIAGAQALFDGLAELADQRGDVRLWAVLSIQACELALRRGQVQAAQSALADVEEWAFYEETNPVKTRLSAVLKAVTGDAVATRELVGRTPDRPPSDRDATWDWLEAQRALGLAALVEEKPAEAAGHLELVWEYTVKQHVDDPGAFPVAPDLVQSLLLMGDAERAREVTERLQALAEAQAHPWGLVSVKRCRAMLALADAYDPVWVETMGAAAAGYADLDLGLDQARTLLCLGTFARRHGKRGDARRYLGQAGAVFDQLGATGWSALAGTELGRVSGRKATADELTAAERQVVELAMSGLANKEIASSLCVSVYTVEAHLSHAYAKLGVRSRSQLAGRLGQLGQAAEV